MLAKVINLKSGWKTVAHAAHYVAEGDEKDLADPGSYEPSEVAQYVARDGAKEGGSINMEELNPIDSDDREQIIKMMDAKARAWSQKTTANKKTNPFYHCVLSWPKGEQPTREQVKEASLEALKAVGLENNQAFFVIHRDKEHHHHVHIIANRVHPEHLVLTGPPKFDYLLLDKACRHIELEQGWSHDNGPHAVVDGQVKRLTHSQRRQLGLIKDKTQQPYSPPVKGRMGEVQSGLPSLSGWLKNKVAPELVATKNWQEFHQACALRGLSVIKVKSGFIFETAMLDKTTQTKASAVHYSLSLGRLQQRFGEYQPAEKSQTDKKTSPLYGKTYTDYVGRVAAGIDTDSDENPGKTGNGEKREQARIARAAARVALFEKYKTERYTAQDTRKEARLELRERHSNDKKELLSKISNEKKIKIKSLQDQYGKQVGKSLWAAKKTAALELLAERQRNERLALTRAHSMDWIPWLERQAASGNEAAISALRGLRYRSQRQENKNKPGIEGEDLGETKTNESNGIGGAAKDSFNIRTAQMRITKDHSIEYLDSTGSVRLTDQGPRIDLTQEDDLEAMRAGLLLASEKYGGEVFITGSLAFREVAAKEAFSMGIKVKNPELADIKRDRNKNKSDEIER